VAAGRGRQVYFCGVAPEQDHVHLYFEHGIFMVDTDDLLLGEGVTRKVRWVALGESDPIPETQLIELVREGARVALLSRSERFMTALDREAGPGGPASS
jgi:hypothetical protein